MKHHPLRLLSPRSLRTAALLVLTSSAAWLGAAPALSAADANTNESVQLMMIKGSATNTISSLIFNDDGTISIESEQVGHLTHFGNFTGHFSYLAVPTPVAILLTGRATLINRHGDKLFLTASITELGTDYPYTVTGALTVTAGTAAYAGAKGFMRVSGNDTASLTDTLKLDGVLTVSSDFQE